MNLYFFGVILSPFWLFVVAIKSELSLLGPYRDIFKLQPWRGASGTSLVCLSVENFVEKIVRRNIKLDPVASLQQGEGRNME